MAAISSATASQSSVQAGCFSPACPNRENVGLKVSSCARCLFATYCDKECQKADWQIHKGECARHVVFLACAKIANLVKTQTDCANAYVSDTKRELPSLAVSSHDFMHSHANRETLERMHAPIEREMREKMRINREAKEKVVKEIQEIDVLIRNLSFSMKALTLNEQSKTLELIENMKRFKQEDVEALGVIDDQFSFLVQVEAEHGGKLASSVSRRRRH